MGGVAFVPGRAISGQARQTADDLKIGVLSIHTGTLGEPGARSMLARRKMMID